jgi:hypothetical protein
MKTLLIEERHRVGYAGQYVLIVPDHAAGRRGRYTVYLIPSSPSRDTQVLGRELPLGQARRIARKLCVGFCVKEQGHDSGRNLA